MDYQKVRRAKFMQILQYRRLPVFKFFFMDISVYWWEKLRNKFSKKKKVFESNQEIRRKKNTQISYDIYILSVISMLSKFSFETLKRSSIKVPKRVTKAYIHTTTREYW